MFTVVKVFFYEIKQEKLLYSRKDFLFGQHNMLWNTYGLKSRTMFLKKYIN